MSHPPEFELKLVREGYRIASYRRCTILMWMGAPQLQAHLELRSVLEERFRKNPEPVVQLVVIPASQLRPPTESERQEMAETIRRFEAFGAGMIVLSEATGFVAATIRAVFGARNLLSKRRHPFYLASHAREVAARLEQLLPGSGHSASELEEALRLMTEGEEAPSLRLLASR